MKINRTGFFYILFLCWTGVIIAFLSFELNRINVEVENLAKTQARANFNKDQAIRHWASLHGGIYVPVDSVTRPNPALSHVKYRDIETPDGRKLTLMNPAYMIRQLNEYFAKFYGVKGHITSEKLIRPENKPDDWELSALKQFEKGATEVSEHSDINGEPYLRLMQPMITKESCLKCHAVQGYKVGDVRGGVSISIPMKPIQEKASVKKRFSVFSMSVLWLIGSVALIVMGRRLNVSIRAQQRSEEALMAQNEKLTEATEKLAKSEKILLEAQKVAHLGHWQLDIVNNRLMWSDEVYRIFGLKPREIVATYEAFLEKIHPDDRERVNQVYMDSLESKSQYEIEHRLLLGSGEIKYVLENCNTRYDENGKPISSMGTVLDITQRKEIELELKKQNDEYLALYEEYKATNEELYVAKAKAEESDNLKTEFIHNMSHEIRTPMNGILGFTKILNSKVTEEGQKYYLGLIQTSGKQLVRIIDDILEISRLGTRQEVVRNEEVCLNELCVELFSVFNIQAREKNISFFQRLELSNEKSHIITDKMKLNKILTSLLENSFKFTAEGYVEFGYDIQKEKNESVLVLFVKDTGIGISQKNQLKVFKRFAQENEQIAQNYGGLGLGLSLASENAALLGGEITIESEKNMGATFYVRLPYRSVDTDKINNSLLHKQFDYKDKSFTMLIVEDEEVNYLYLKTLLEISNLNVSVLWAKNGKEAVEMCTNMSEIDVVFMDIKMSVMNGYEATKIIKNIRPQLPVIAQTAYSTKEDESRAISAGCDDFIPKPIDEKILSSVLSLHLSTKKIS